MKLKISLTDLQFSRLVDALTLTREEYAAAKLDPLTAGEGVNRILLAREALGLEPKTMFSPTARRYNASSLESKPV